MILDEAPTAVTIELPPLPEAWVARLGAILEPLQKGKLSLPIIFY